tara:strand:- start:10901 stop:11452 length:552 start_codon:yes stop_codon:yes gene_type:complete
MKYDKIIYKYRYLQLDFKDLKEEDLKLKSIFENDFKNLLSMFKIEENTEDTEELHTIDERVKCLYKHICKFVHPDKGGSNKVFSKLNNSYKENDILGILSIAMDESIDIILEDDDMILLQNSITNIENKIINQKNTFSYIWEYGTQEQRANILDTLESKYGVKFTIDDLNQCQKEKLGLQKIT